MFIAALCTIAKLFLLRQQLMGFIYIYIHTRQSNEAASNCFKRGRVEGERQWG
jgi:hypothetical protein